jgi:molybdopterin converting factor small subunit
MSRRSGSAAPATSGDGDAAADESFPVTIEVVSWVNQFVGGSGSGSVEISEAARAGETIRNLLHRVSQQHPRLRDALWDPDTGDQGPHIEIIVNEAVLGIEHELDSALRPGDRLILIGQYIGG